MYRWKYFCCYGEILILCYIDWVVYFVIGKVVLYVRVIVRYLDIVVFIY